MALRTTRLDTFHEKIVLIKTSPKVKSTINLHWQLSPEPMMMSLGILFEYLIVLAAWTALELYLHYQLEYSTEMLQTLQLTVMDVFWGRGLTTRFLYVGPFLETQFWTTVVLYVWQSSQYFLFSYSVDVVLILLFILAQQMLVYRPYTLRNWPFTCWIVWKNYNIHLPFLYFSTLRWHRQLQYFLLGDTDLIILYTVKSLT